MMGLYIYIQIANGFLAEFEPEKMMMPSLFVMEAVQKKMSPVA